MAGTQLGAVRQLPRQEPPGSSPQRERVHEIKPEATHRRRRIRIDWARLVLIAAVCYVVVSLATQQVRVGELQQEAEQLETSLAAAQSQNQQLTTELEKLQTDQGYLELVARSELGMVKEGEVEYIFNTR